MGCVLDMTVPPDILLNQLTYGNRLTTSSVADTQGPNWPAKNRWLMAQELLKIACSLLQESSEASLQEHASSRRSWWQNVRVRMVLPW